MLDEVNWWWKVYYLVDYMFAYGCYKLGLKSIGIIVLIN